MDKFRLGGFGCLAALVSGALALAVFFGGGAAAGAGAYLLGLAAAAMVLAGTLGLRERFGLLLFPLAGTLLVVGSLAILAATFASLSAAQARDASAVSAAQAGVFFATLAFVLGWMLIGAALLIRRKAVTEALGEGHGAFVLVSGLLLVLIPLVGLIAVLPLALLFLRLSKAAPAAATPPPA